VPGRKGPWLPFVRMDTSRVPKEFYTQDHMYISHVQSGMFWVTDGGAITATAEDESSASVFHFEVGETQPGSKITDGDFVRVRDYQTGNYLTAQDDFNKLTMEPLRPTGKGNEQQEFELGKIARPARFRHNDIVFLESWLSCVVEADTGCAETPLLARRWKRGPPQQIMCRKKRLLEDKSTEVARQMQFQAFDLTGNAMVTRSEMGYFLQQIKEGTDGVSLDDVMAACDPEQVGGATRENFAAWADSGTMPEAFFNHGEALGNVAQRVRDCLEEEAALIEVLATLPSDLIEKTRATFVLLTGEDLVEKIVAKTSEQDGYIFSNYWQLAMKQLLVDPVDLWCQALQDAMDGLGTDEDTLTALVCTIPEEFRDSIHQRYKERKGQSLLAHIKSETSFNYQKVLLAQATTPALARAQALNGAMVGLGTDEGQLIRIVTACDRGERLEIMEVYERAYNKLLVEHIDSEISGDFKKTMHAIFTTEESEYDLDADCQALKEAMEGWGTDEEALIKLVCSKTKQQMRDIRQRFEETEGRKLVDWVESETSGYFQDALLGLIRSPIDALCYGVRDCIKGFGTDDTGLITLVTHLPEFKRLALIKRYYELFQRDVLADIRNDTSGDYQKALLACVRPPPAVWASTLKSAMKGLGTADSLLINFLCIAKDHMDEVREIFDKENSTPLYKWIEGECSGDYKRVLVALSLRSSADRVDMAPIYWAQRCADALYDVTTLKTLLTSLPAVVLRRAGDIYKAVYGDSLAEGIKKKCEEGRGFSFFTDYWKITMQRLLELPVGVRAIGLNDAMKGWGTDEFTLTALICTVPENMHKDVQEEYERRFGRKLVEHVESETSFNYKKLLVAATHTKVQSRCVALNAAMKGMGTDEKQLIRVIVCATMKERELIRQAYQEMFDKDLIEHVESETSGDFKGMLVALLESCEPEDAPDYEGDADVIIDSFAGSDADFETITRKLAAKTPSQLEELAAAYEAKAGESLKEKLAQESASFGESIFGNSDFKSLVQLLMQPPAERLASSVRYCIEGWGTDDTGLITCLVHLSERQRKELVETYTALFDRDIYEDIEGDTSGDYKQALLACVRPPPETYCKALRGAMKGLGTADNLLINWMCIAKDRIDEVREAFSVMFEGEDLASWIDGDCSGDYKDTLLRIASRECLKFPGVENGVTAQAPPTQEEAVKRFNRTFNDLCTQKRNKPDELLIIPERQQQELGCAFMYWASRSSVSPNLDMAGMWDMTNALSMPPADDGPDLRATFREWDFSGTGEVDWNDFVKEMTTRVNDEGHYNADPLPEK